MPWNDASTNPPDADIAVLASSRRGFRIVTYDGRHYHDYWSPLVIILDITHWTDLPEEP